MICRNSTLYCSVALVLLTSSLPTPSPPHPLTSSRLLTSFLQQFRSALKHHSEPTKEIEELRELLRNPFVQVSNYIANAIPLAFLHCQLCQGAFECGVGPSSHDLLLRMTDIPVLLRPGLPHHCPHAIML